MKTSDQGVSPFVVRALTFGEASKKNGKRVLSRRSLTLPEHGDMRLWSREHLHNDLS